MPCLILARGGFQRCDAAKASERGLVTASPGVRPRDEDLRGDEGADAWFVEESGANLTDDREHRQLEFAAFDRQLLDPVCRASQGQFCGGVLGLGGSIWTKPDAPVDEPAERESAEVLPEINGCRDDERLEHVDRGDAGEFRGIPGHDERSQALA